MKFETKFNHGDEVFIITKHITYKEETCDVCNNEKRININGKFFTCPSCHGNIRKIADGQKWELYTHVTCGKIGKIIIESYEYKYCDEENYLPISIKYMLDSTGVGSGTIWKEEDLFLTRKDALYECEKRNNG